MIRSEFLSTFAVDPAAYIEEHEGKYHFFHEGKATKVRCDTARWALKRLAKYVRSYKVGSKRRFVCVFPDTRERLFLTFAVRDGMELLERKALVDAVVEDAHESVELGVKKSLLALPEPVFLELIDEARGRVKELFEPRRRRKA